MAASMRSRRERPAKPALSSAGIVAAAVGIMDSEGLERVTMRRLAQELDTGPASLYVYFGNTAELHAAVLDDLLGEVDLGPVTGPGTWRARLVAVLESYLRVLFERPSLARSALVARPRGDNYLALVEGLLAVLESGGVDRARAAWGVDLLLQFATATAAEQGTRRDAPDDWMTLPEGASERYPHLAAAAEDLFSGTPRQRLGWMFDVLVNGIQTSPHPR